MDAHKQLTIGLFGFGVVGEGLYKVLQQTPSLKASIKKVCIKHSGKIRNAPASLFTTEKEDLLFDENINVIVEVIDDANAAFEIIYCPRNGKARVPAKMIANIAGNSANATGNRAPFCMKPQPVALSVIRNLEEYYDKVTCYQSHCKWLNQFYSH